MLVLLMAVLGLPAGFAIDALVARYAVPFEDDEEESGLESEAAHVAGGTGDGAREPAETRVWLRRGLIVAGTVVLFAVAGARFETLWHLPLVAAYVAVLVTCAATDALVFRVPNAVTYPAIVGALVVGAVVPGANIAEVLAGALLAGGVLFVPALLTGGSGMGMGDVKLGVFVGLSLGFVHAVPALLVMALGGGLVAIVLLVSGLRKRGEPIPYAPFISAGGLVALLWQGPAFVQLI